MDTLYHYCSSSTFASIVSHKSIWLSSLSLSNDSMEGRLVSKTFERLLSQSKVGIDEMQEIRDAITFAEDIFDGLGFCLSQKPDLLSQWRGYADDGQGFSIGFTKEYLQKLAKTKEDNEPGFRLNKVVYELDEHEATLMPTYIEIKELIDSGQLKRPVYGLLSIDDEEQIKKRKDEYLKSTKELWLKIIKTFPNVHMLKSKAFSEEEEWRLVSYLSKDPDDYSSFRASGNRLIPYREFKLKPLDVNSIAEVYVGPKNITPIFVLEKFLVQNGFPDVKIYRSAATYR